ncbi:MAG: glucokinase [Frankiales bacterium]|nr:glucokinase [Frankiales bacterium]
MLAIGIDVGGTKVAAGVVDENGAILARTRRATPSASAAEVERTIADVVAELRAGHDVGAVGIGAAGYLDKERARVVFAPNLAWRDEPLRDEVAALVRLPVTLENDANAAAWGEHRFGAGQSEPTLVCLTVGTGIGGGIVLDGTLFLGAFGIGAEFGHFQLVPNGRRCGCGQRGCFEQYCSGRALLRAAREIADVQKDLGARLLELGGGTPEGIESRHVTTAAQEGDDGALACFAEIGSALGQGLAVLTAILDPGMVVIGGGLAETGELLLGPARATFDERVTGSGHRPRTPVVQAALGNDAGLIGAADLARR